MAYGVSIILLVILAVIYFFYRAASAKRKKLVEKIFTWIVFSVSFALAPIIFNAIVSSMAGKIATIALLLSRGELLLISTSISADAAGRLIGTGDNEKLLKLFAAGGCMLVLFFSSLLFAAIAGSGDTAFKAEQVANMSMFMFFLTMLTSLSSIILAEAE